MSSQHATLVIGVEGQLFVNTLVVCNCFLESIKNDLAQVVDTAVVKCQNIVAGIVVDCQSADAVAFSVKNPKSVSFLTIIEFISSDFGNLDLLPVKFRIQYVIIFIKAENPAICLLLAAKIGISNEFSLVVKGNYPAVFILSILEYQVASKQGRKLILKLFYCSCSNFDFFHHYHPVLFILLPSS